MAVKKILFLKKKIGKKSVKKLTMAVCATGACVGGGDGYEQL